jgi:hypothetical protein
MDGGRGVERCTGTEVAILWAGQKGGGFSELTRGKLAFASQSVLHGFQQAAEIVALKRMLASSCRSACMSEKRVSGCLSLKPGWSMKSEAAADGGGGVAR